MPQKIGKLIADVDLNLRPSTQQWNRFQQSIRKGGGRDSLFGAISGDAREFENSLGKATNRVVAFGAAAAIFTAVARATSEFAKSIVEVDKQLAAINVNLGQSADGLKKFGADLFNVARQTGQTFEVAAGAAAELARQGLSAEETTKRLKDALILSRIAGLDSASAVNALTAAINSFNAEALTSSEVVNKFAAVDTKFAVSSKDLAEAVSRVGSTAQTAGVGLNELIGLVTSLQQTTARGGATIGNGLKTIFTRIQAAPETVNALQGIGVAIKNTDGSLRDGISILKDYASARQKVGEVERQALDRTVAGTFQINVLKALLGDLSKEYSIYGNAVRTATSATDEAARKNEQLNQTIASLLNSTGLSIKQLFSSIGDQSLNGLFKQLLQELEGFRSFFSGESGNELGKSLGDGIISGISNVLTGPAFLALVTILGAAFKKVISTVATEARTLLVFNDTLRARANIQKQINNLLGQATQGELAQYQAANSVLAKKEQILAIQARINQEELAGTPIQRSFQVAGPLGVGNRVSPNIRRGNRYLGVPSFADPIGAAVNREKAAGVPAHQIYVDRDPRVANFANPMGLLVANRRDEPLGGFQGVNRVIAEGGNPKTAGMPNFAPLKSQRDIVQERFGLTKRYEGAALTAAQIAMASTDGVVKSAKKLESTISLLDKAFAPLLRSAKIADSVRRAAIPESPEEVRRAVSGGPYQIPSGGILARNKLPRSARVQPFGPAFPINPQLQKRLEIEADIAAQERIERRFEMSQERRRRQAASIVQRRQTNQNRALGLSFLAPFASGFVDPALKSLGVETTGGTAGGRFSGAVQGAGQGAALGIFGPQAAVLGSAVGALVGFLSKSSKSLAEFNEAIDKTIAAQNAGVDAAQKVVAITQSLSEGNLDSASSVRLRQQKADALLNVDPEFRERLGKSNLSSEDIGKILGEIAAKAERVTRIGEVQKSGRALSQGSFLDRANRYAGPSVAAGPLRALRNLSSQFSNQFEGVDQARGLGKDVAGLVGTYNRGAIDDSVLNRIIGGKEQSGDLDKLTAIYQKLGASVEITADRQIEFAEALKTAKSRFDKYTAILAQLEKEGMKGRLPTNSFTGTPNLDIYRDAALTGRNPLASKGDKAQARFDFLEEMRKEGILTPDQTGDGSLYAQSRAGVQSKNIGAIAEKFLRSNNPNRGSFRDARGNFNFSALEQATKFTANAGISTSPEAQILLSALERRRRTAEDNKINTPGYGPNFDASQSGLAPGGKYSVTAGDALKAAQATVEKTLQMANATILRSQLSIDGTLRILTSDVLSGDALKKIAAEMTAAVGEQFQAQITDLNVRLSKAEGNPVPPTAIPVTSAYGNKMVKGSDGFIRSK